MTERFVIEGIITDKGKGVYCRMVKRWTITWTVNGLAGKWEPGGVKPLLDTERTITFKTYGPGERYRIVRDNLKIGEKIRVYGWGCKDDSMEWDSIWPASGR